MWNAGSVAAVIVLAGTAGAAANGGPARYEPLYDTDYEHYDWSGVYAGVQGGWLWGSNETREIETGPDGLDRSVLSYDASGFAVGGVAGINFQPGFWVYGGEIDAEFTDFSGETISGGGTRLTKDIDFLSSIRGRIGVTVDRALFYATAGLAIASVDLKALGDEPPRAFSDTRFPFGWTAGAGVEVALGKKVSGAIEYRYTDLGETVGEDEFEDSSFRFPHSNEFHAVRARLVWHFGN